MRYLEITTMAKRFTDNQKWRKPFFKGLSTVNKLFFLYLMDDCDHAGVWVVEMDVAELRIGETLCKDDILDKFNGHIHVFDNEQLWFVPAFVEFQYGTLNPSVNAHKSVIGILKKNNLTKKYEQFIKCSLTLKDKDKDKAKDKDKDKVKDKYLEFVLLTKEEHFKLIDSFGDNKVSDMILNLNDYIGSKGTKYKSHYHTILTWERREAKKNPPKHHVKSDATVKVEKIEEEKIRRAGL